MTLVAVLVLVVGREARSEVLIVLSQDAPAYREVSDAFKGALAAGRETGARPAATVERNVRSIANEALTRYELVVTIGLAAAEAVLDRDEPAVPRTLCLLIPRTSFESLIGHRNLVQQRRVSAVYIDQPIGRQLDLIHAALPGRTRLGVIFGPSSVALRDELRAGAPARDLALRLAEVSEPEGMYAASQAILPEVDVLLALPDSIAFNSSTAYLVMLASYRAQIPVVGFSDSLANAGALLAIFSTLQQQGRHGAEVAVRALAEDSKLESPQYPRYFTVRSNDSVARSLGIHLADPRSLERTVAERAASTRGPALQREGAPMPGRTP
jgi:putative ABC transport system substrate-binding protein